MPRGEHDNHAAILSPELVKEIRQMYLKGDYSFSEIALAFGVEKATIQSILTGNTWKHVLADGEAEALKAMRQERYYRRYR